MELKLCIKYKKIQWVKFAHIHLLVVEKEFQWDKQPNKFHWLGFLNIRKSINIFTRKSFLRLAHVAKIHTRMLQVVKILRVFGQFAITDG